MAGMQGMHAGIIKYRARRHAVKKRDMQQRQLMVRHKMEQAEEEQEDQARNKELEQEGEHVEIQKHDEPRQTTCKLNAGQHAQ